METLQQSLRLDRFPNSTHKMIRSSKPQGAAVFRLECRHMCGPRHAIKNRHMLDYELRFDQRRVRLPLLGATFPPGYRLLVTARNCFHVRVVCE